MTLTDRETSTPTTKKRGRADWQALGEANLPPETDVIRRNAAITGTYARWYSEQPHLLKWAGMATFASHRVGLALRPYEFHVLDGLITGVSDAQTHELQVHTILSDLHYIRETNNMIFHDIGWAHLAYLSPEGGLAAVEGGLAGDTTGELILEGFRWIDQGRQLLAEQPAQRREAEELIWRGNRLLLQHEQSVIVQAQFDKLDFDCTMFLTLGTIMNFSADYLALDVSESSSFYEFLWWRGLWLLLLTRSLPRITNLRHRWFWCQKALVPLWRKVEAHDPRLQEKLAILMQGGSQ